MKTIAVANVKGGTGKTTLAVHLATGLARKAKTLLGALSDEPKKPATLSNLIKCEGCGRMKSDYVAPGRHGLRWVQKGNRRVIINCAGEEVQP